MTNKLGFIHKSLIHRELLPPPISSYKVRNKLHGSARPTLLHQAYASCGRVLWCLALCLMLLPFAFASCGKDVMEPEELDPLTRAAADSLRDSCQLNITLQCDTSWAGTKTIYF